MGGVLAVVGFALGAVIGSFLNVVIHRVPAGLSVVRPASACPSCGSTIRPYDNIPIVSWLILRARCRDCAAPISARYPLIELGTALAFTAIVLSQGESILTGAASDAVVGTVVLFVMLYFAALSIALAAIDIEKHRLPNVIVLPAYGVVAGGWIVAAIVGGDYGSAARAAAGAGVLFAFYFLLAVIAPRGMGMGDVKLAGVIGLVLGWFGWEQLAVGSLSAFLLGGAFGIVLIVLRRAHRGSGIPFGPWMLIGAWVGIVWGYAIAGAYLDAVGLT